MKTSILIIEDDLIIAENLKENLEELGYQVPNIISSYDEIKNVDRFKEYDLTIVDVHLANSSKDGIEIVSEKKLGEQMPLIYLTAFADDKTTSRAKHTKPSAYLIKPASKQQIAVAIDFAMDEFMVKTVEEELHTKSKHCPLYSGNGNYYAKIGDRYERIKINEIVMIKASGSYSTIYTENRDYTISANLKNVLAQIVSSDIHRCQRSYAVNKNYIQSFDEDSLYVIRGAEVHCVPLGNSFKKEVLSFLPKIKAD
jgi:DNA-binding LytR/AlgR family response regulator